MSKLPISQIYVGMPVTMHIGSDSYPYEVISITGKSTVIIREVKPINQEDWASGCYTDEYVSNPKGKVKELSNRGKHGWHVVGDYRSPSYGWCYRVSFGKAVYYRDPSF